MSIEARIAVTGGVHGDEPSGAAALLPLSELGFLTFGPCNLWGLANKKRELEDGRDLNRSFALKDCKEAEAVRQWLTLHKPRMVLDLHEDARTDKPYLIQYDPPDPRGKRLIERLRSGQPWFPAIPGYPGVNVIDFAPRPRYGWIGGRDGLLRPSSLLLWFVKVWKQWPLAFWAARSLNASAFVVEAPAAWPLERKIEFHIAVARAATEAL